MTLQAKAIKHIDVSGKEMYYVKLWYDDESKNELVYLNMSKYNKVLKLGGPIYGKKNVDNIPKGKRNVLDNSRDKR